MVADHDHDQDDQQRYSQRTDEDVLDAVAIHEPAATSEVGEELGISRQGADYRLRKLEEEGHVQKKKIAKSLVWFRDEGRGDSESSD